MEALLNELQGNRNTFLEKEKQLIPKGYFNINLSNSTCRFKLKGDFTGRNIDWISKSMITRKLFYKKFIELDMSEVDTIDMQAMALLIIALKKLKERGAHTKVTGLNDRNLNLANELGMRFIAHID